MFQFPPRHVPNSQFREIHCCCEPEVIVPSTFESVRKPPLDHPPSQSLISPLMCVRRIDTPCETAQMLALPSIVGVTAMFSTARQKLHVAFPRIHPALARTAPVIETSSGERPSPIRCV